MTLEFSENKLDWNRFTVKYIIRKVTFTFTGCVEMKSMPPASWPDVANKDSVSRIA